MNKSILTLAIAAALSSQVVLVTVVSAEEESLPTINVESTTLSDVSEEQVKSADLAEALQKNVPSISIVRRSGIANDIILRGQKKDNINILIDDAKIYGACPNRMDPPTSHVLTNNIYGIEITEGPYDVENFGTLSGAVKITTKKPSKEFEGEVNVNLGSWGYRKAATTVSGGNDKVRALFSISKETSEQYEDGDGNDFSEQLEAVDAPAMNRYKPEFVGIDAYDKQSFMGKVYVDVTEDQELKLSYTANRSDDILYPSTPMDALYDDSDIFTAQYTIKNLGNWSKELDFQLYNSEVEHPMSTFYRVASGPGSVNEKVSHLETEVQGFKVKNSFDLDEMTELTYGLDYSVRNWDGNYEGTGTQALIDGFHSIDDVDTENRAVFVVLDKDFPGFNLKAGARYDDTTIETGGNAPNQPDNDYTAFSGYVFGTYQLNETTKLFGGLGRAHRVPDARELYFRGAMINTSGPMPMPMNPQLGTPTLDQTRNDEIDFGIENNFENLVLKTKVFHSWLTDFIHYRSTPVPGSMMNLNRFENVDATIYGLDVSGSYFINDEIYLDFGLAYQRGEKDEPLSGQTDTDLAEIPPLKANLALNYEYANRSNARVEVVAADKWDRFDGDNGEQELDSYAVVNLKVQHQLTNQFEITAGIDNIFDRTYAVSNTYNDLTLISSGATGEVMLINEPGRYVYVNTTFRF
ncbi:MAG: TonB-dependent receptor [Candidatus Thiodiazotropha sp. (ex Monitilora ramsayi)]|nr:TonB-dependent receptor [Candidatus Thiodiazotropha sp. (ex Monitilora ramsayi)]